MAHQFARICVFGDVRVQFRQQARQQSHGLRRERAGGSASRLSPVNPGASSSTSRRSAIADRQLRGDAGFCGHGPAAALKSPSAGSKQDVNPLFAQTVRHGCRFA